MRGRGRRKGGWKPGRRGILHRRPGPGRRGRARGASAAGPGKDRRIGELKLHRDGYGFVIADKAGQGDVFIPARCVGDALHTDVVEVRVVPGSGELLEGRITKIVERRVKQMVGRFERHGRVCQVIADDRRVRHRIVVPDDKIGGARHNDNVIVRILRYPQGGRPMLGSVTAVLGERGDEATEKAAVIARHQLERGFSAKAIAEAKAAYPVFSTEGGRGTKDEGRADLRDISFVTIDGETAKDFDDAVAVKELGGGNMRLWVSIADVSFFAHPQSALDGEAYERGTSVYFPGDCIPMLPEALSNDLCSLRPKEDRFTVTAEMDIDVDGRVAASRFYRSVIRSRERMTYTSIKRILVERSDDERARYRELVPQFELMEKLFSRLKARRSRRGSIDFDLPEPEIVIDMQGEIADIVRAERHVGHMMIEEFMIVANEAVARFLTDHGASCIYRVHESPPAGKLREFAILLSNLGIKSHIKPGVAPGKLAKVVEMVRNRPEERLVNHMLLRSMAQAVYSPENIGHYGLASRCYCHFTSPIRRYPDLVVHRLLTRVIDEGRPMSHGSVKRLREIAEHCSRRERIAMEAEREMAKLHAAMFMQGQVGQEFDGIISHVTKFGFFVELVEFFVEGLVRISSLDDDRYSFQADGCVIKGKRSRRAFRIGDRVRIEVEEVDIPNREIVFLLV